MKNSAWVLGFAGLVIMGEGVPNAAFAQTSEIATVRTTPITLNTEGTTLYAALKLMFGQAKADFTIVDSLKTLPVTVHLNQPFGVALDSVLKAAGAPITYSVEHGIYRIIPAPDEQEVMPVVEREPPQEPVMPKIFKPYVKVLKMRNLNGVDVGALLGAKPILWISAFDPKYWGYPPSIGNPNMGSFGGGFGGNSGFGGGLGGGFGGYGQSPLGTGGSPFDQDDNQFGNGNGFNQGGFGNGRR